MHPIVVPPELQDALTDHGEAHQLQAGDVLFCQGDPSDAVYFVVSGKLIVQRQGSEGGPSTVLNYIMPGEITGEIGAMTGWSRTATLTAERSTRLRRIPIAEFRTLMRDWPSLARLVMKTTGSHLVSADVERETLGHSYQKMQLRISSLGEEKAQLQELLRLRDELEAMLVHDLKNPLGIIQAGLNLLEPLVQEEEDETYANVFALMLRATGRTQRLITTLLDIAKMEAGQPILRIGPVNLLALASTLINEQLPPKQSQHVKLKAQTYQDLDVEGDRDVLSRVLANLIDNALKFSPEGQSVIVEITPADAIWVEIAVTDRGPGIPPEERERIFEKFTQVQSPHHARRRGTGLGLTFCRMAVEAHGGKIWVEPGPRDRGARFRVRLPRTQPETMTTTLCEGDADAEPTDEAASA
jgi:signal transduction histidine kinase